MLPPWLGIVLVYNVWPILIKGCVSKINGGLFLHLGHSLMIFISLFSPLPLFLLQQTCIQGLNRKWCSSLPGSILGKHPRPSSAKVSVCRQIRWDPCSCWCVCGVDSFGSERGHDRFFHGSFYQQNRSSNTQLIVLLEAVGIDCLQVWWMFAERGQKWTVLGSEAIWEEWDSHTHIQYICVKVLFLELSQPVFLGFILLTACFFLAVYYLQLLFHHKAVTLALQLNSKRPLFVWNCCSEEHSSQWLTAVSCTKHSC